MSGKIASRSQLLGLAGQLVQHMPADLEAEVAQEWADNPMKLEEFLAGLRNGTFPIDTVTTRHFSVMIDPKLAAEEWVEAVQGCGGHTPDTYLNNENMGRFLTVRKEATEPYQVNLVAFHLVRTGASTEEVKRVRRRLHLKSVGFEHLAAVGATYPKFHSDIGWLINLDIVISENTGSYDDDDNFVPCLFGNPDGKIRTFGLTKMTNKWSGDFWFLGQEK